MAAFFYSGDEKKKKKAELNARPFCLCIVLLRLDVVNRESIGGSRRY